MVLQLKDIKKSYQKRAGYALAGFTMEFTPGIYGILGPNGAGKSTLMNIITDNLKADSGEVRMDGVPVGKLGAGYRKLLGYMPQQQELYSEFTGEEFLWYIASLKGLKKKEAASQIAQMMQVVNLDHAKNKKLKSYSGGMKQRILIAQALLGEPKLLVLDEPTAGLDPRERIRLRNFISEAAEDKIVLLSTHVVSDVESVSKEIVIMRAGVIQKRGTVQELFAQMEGKVFEGALTVQEQEALAAQGAKVANVAITATGRIVRIVTDTRPVGAGMEAVCPCLEDVYLYVT